MLEVDHVLNIKQLAAKGQSIRAIARETGFTRKTVRKYLKGDAVPGVYRMIEPRVQPVRDAIRDRVGGLLREELSRKTPRKQRLTAARIHRILASEAVEASASTVRDLVAEVRLDLRDPLEHAFLTLEYDPGVDAQVDFFEAEYDDSELGRTKAYVLLVRACYSAKTFAYIAPSQTFESLVEGLTRAFDFFGGVFLVLWFDNLTPAVKRILRGRDRQIQKRFSSFVAHYGFRVEFCAPGKGNEKGGVEGEVKYSRHEIFSPIPKADGRKGLQEIAEAWMARDSSRTTSGRRLSIGELFKHEVSKLLTLPGSRFDAARVSHGHVSSRALVSIVTNVYSVPVEWVGRTVTVKMRAESVDFFGPNRESVRHGRLYGREGMSIELDHFLPLLRRKHRGLDRAVPVRRFLESESPSWTALLSALRRRLGDVEGGKEFIEVLFLCRTHERGAVTAAVECALRDVEVSLGAVRYHLWSGIERARERVESISCSGTAAGTSSVMSHTPAAYMDLLLLAETGEEVALRG